MKKSQLNRIIKEVIKEQKPILLQEQVGVPTFAQPPCSPGQMLSSFANYGNLNWQTTSQCMPTVRKWLMNLFSGAGMQTPVFMLHCNPPTPLNAPNQPCQFINNRIQSLTGWINNFSGNPQSQQLANKQCKLDIFTALLPWAQATWNQPGSMTGC